KYNLTYDDVCNKYNSYIIMCANPSQKAIPYKNYYNKEAPFIEYKLAICFEQYANQRGITDFCSSIDKIKNLDVNSDDWIERNNKANEIIKEMRLNSINALETEGEFIGLPTLKELELLKLLSTTLTRKEILDVLTKLGVEV